MRGISCLSLRLQGVWISYLILDSDSGSSEAETDNAIKTQNAQETYNKYDIKNNKDIQDTNETFNNTNKPQNNTIYTKKDQQQLKENQTDISKTMNLANPDTQKKTVKRWIVSMSPRQLWDLSKSSIIGNKEI